MLLSGGLSLGHLFPQVLSESCLSEALLKIKHFTEEQRFPFKSWRILFGRQVIFSKASRNRWEHLSQLLTTSHASCLEADKSMATENPKAEANPIVALCLGKLATLFSLSRTCCGSWTRCGVSWRCQGARLWPRRLAVLAWLQILKRSNWGCSSLCHHLEQSQQAQCFLVLCKVWASFESSG